MDSTTCISLSDWVVDVCWVILLFLADPSIYVGGVEAKSQIQPPPSASFVICMCRPSKVSYTVPDFSLVIAFDKERERECVFV